MTTEHKVFIGIGLLTLVIIVGGVWFSSKEEIKNTASGAGTAPQETTPPVTEPENEEPTNEEKPVSVIPEATVRGNVVGPVLE